jgi:hypothetical protein
MSLLPRTTLHSDSEQWARATFFESAIAIPQLEGSTSAIAIPQLFKEMLLRNRNSAIPQSQFFLMSVTCPQFSAYFWLWNAVGVHEKKIGGKKSRATVPLRQVFGFQRNRQF